MFIDQKQYFQESMYSNINPDQQLKLQQSQTDFEQDPSMFIDKYEKQYGFNSEDKSLLIINDSHFKRNQKQKELSTLPIIQNLADDQYLDQNEIKNKVFRIKKKSQLSHIPVQEIIHMKNFQKSQKLISQMCNQDQNTAQGGSPFLHQINTINKFDKNQKNESFRIQDPKLQIDINIKSKMIKSMRVKAAIQKQIYDIAQRHTDLNKLNELCNYRQLVAHQNVQRNNKKQFSKSQATTAATEKYDAYNNILKQSINESNEMKILETQKKVKKKSEICLNEIQNKDQRIQLLQQIIENQDQIQFKNSSSLKSISLIQNDFQAQNNIQPNNFDFQQQTFSKNETKNSTERSNDNLIDLKKEFIYPFYQSSPKQDNKDTSFKIQSLKENQDSYIKQRSNSTIKESFQNGHDQNYQLQNKRDQIIEDEYQQLSQLQKIKTQRKTIFIDQSDNLNINQVQKNQNSSFQKYAQYVQMAQEKNQKFIASPQQFTNFQKQFEAIKNNGYNYLFIDNNKGGGHFFQPSQKDDVFEALIALSPILAKTTNKNFSIKQNSKAKSLFTGSRNEHQNVIDSSNILQTKLVSQNISFKEREQQKFKSLQQYFGPIQNISKNQSSLQNLSNANQYLEIEGESAVLQSQKKNYDILQKDKNIYKIEEDEFRDLFDSLGLCYDEDVPEAMKTKLKANKNAKSVLQQVAKDFIAKQQQVKIFENDLLVKGIRHSNQKLEDLENGKKDKRLTKSLINDYSQSNLDLYAKKQKQTQQKQPNQDEISAFLNQNICQAVKPGEPTLINIINQPFNKHASHPINKILKLGNDFCSISLIKAAHFKGSSQKQAIFDIPQIQILARQLKIEIPKNLMGNDFLQLFKSKQFIVQVKSQFFQKLFDQINKENDMKLNFERSQFQFYKGFIGRGNNAQLIVQLFKQHRWWWSIYQNLQHDEDGNIIFPPSMHNQQTNMQLYKESFVEHNFLWTQWKKLKHFQFLKQSQPLKENAVQEEKIQIDHQSNVANISNSFKVYAKIENNYHLSNKFALFYNMRKYYKIMQRDPFDILPLTYHIKKGIQDPIFQNFVIFYEQIEKQKAQASRDEKELQKLQKFYEDDLRQIQEQIDNLKIQNPSFQDEIEENQKNKLQQIDLQINESLLKIKKSPNKSKKKFHFVHEQQENQQEIPEIDQNYSLIENDYQGNTTDEKQDKMIQLQQIQQEIEKFTRIHQRQNQNLVSTKEKIETNLKIKHQKNMWIVKPGENTNRGTGISVQTKLNDIKQLVGQESTGSRTFILQKYIENPALFKNRKFDIRCFTMVTSVNGNLKGFTYDEGYLRTSGREFNLKSTNKYIHLTNDAVQKKSEDYGRFEFGNKVSFVEYQHYLNSTVPHLNIDFKAHIFSQIKRIMTDTIRACYKILDPNQRLHSFEIFGYDFMLDDNFKVYLIEVNTNPCLETTCPILQKVITDMVDSGLRIAIDPMFPPPNYQKRLSLQIPITQWELCYDSKLDNKELDELFRNYEMKQDENDKKQKKKSNLNVQNNILKQIQDEKDDFDDQLIKEEEIDKIYE